MTDFTPPSSAVHLKSATVKILPGVKISQFVNVSTKSLCGCFLTHGVLMNAATAVI